MTLTTPWDRPRVDIRQSASERPDSRFLQLPGEIRNRIYEYTFHTDHGLDFIPGDNTTVDEDDHNDRKPYFTATTSVTHDLQNEFNQLKYVCLQLYHETKCLEFSRNTLSFCGEYKKGDHQWLPAREFAEFLHGCTPSKAQLMSNIQLSLKAFPEYLVEDLTWDEPMSFRPEHFCILLLESSSSFETIARFCRKHPKASVSYTVENLDPAEDLDGYSSFGHRLVVYLEQLALMRTALRHQNLSTVDILFSNGYDAAAPYAQSWASRRCVKELQVPNLKFALLTGELGHEENEDKLDDALRPWGIGEWVISPCIELYKSVVKYGV